MRERKVMWVSLGVGVVALAIGAVGGAFGPGAFMRAYLVGWLLCLGVALGSMGVVMLHHLTGGEWGWGVRRLGEAAGMTVPGLAVMFVPVAVGAGYLYPWVGGGGALLRHRGVLFGTGFTLARAFGYLAIWSLWAWRLRRLSLAQDRTGDAAIPGRLRAWSAAGLVVYFVTMSLAAVDWIGSREVDWYSSTFGLAVIVGQGVAGVAFLIVVWWGVSRAAGVAAGALQDLGNLLLTVVVLWSYISFAQFLVIWMGNSQEDIVWFVHRTRGGWWWVTLGLIVLHFAVPFGFFVVSG